jgi:hypothetical protein
MSYGWHRSRVKGPGLVGLQRGRTESIRTERTPSPAKLAKFISVRAPAAVSGPEIRKVEGAPSAAKLRENAVGGWEGQLKKGQLSAASLIKALKALTKGPDKLEAPYHRSLAKHGGAWLK